LSRRWFRSPTPLEPRRPVASRSLRTKLLLEALEDRTAPAIFTVGPGDVAGLIAAIWGASADRLRALLPKSTRHLG
jgi:hypothetical protein